MNSPLFLVPWLVLGIPIISIRKEFVLLKKQRKDYSHYLEWKEFPHLKIVAGKSVFSFLLGLASVLYEVPLDKMFIGLGVLGTCGYVLEATITLDRPQPTRGYAPSRTVCQKCRSGEHDDCTNLRMLDGFEMEFKTKEGFSRPVCCCGFRLGLWEEIPG